MELAKKNSMFFIQTSASFRIAKFSGLGLMFGSIFFVVENVIVFAGCNTRSPNLLSDYEREELIRNTLEANFRKGESLG
ncbi:hypothetical protein YC2023_101759 [Brassica napus]